MNNFQSSTTDSILQVVVGLGKTGLSCVQFLAAQNIPLAVTDSRENPPGLAEIQTQFPHIPLSLGKLDANLCAQADRLIVSPGVSIKEPAIANAIAKGIPAIGDIELFAQCVDAPVVAITGSNGKSTVTTLVGEMVRKAGLNVCVGGNLGTPVLDLLFAKKPDVYVLELSSFQLETTFSLKPQAAVLLNLSEDHMDRYRDLDDYLAAKQRIYRGCHTAIVNREEPKIWENFLAKNISTIGFSLGTPNASDFGLRQSADQWYLAKGEILLVPTSALKIKGRHQLANALAALALGDAIHLPMPAMLAALADFQGLAHRCQWVANFQGVDWYNDSKATNVGAAQAALAGLGAEIKGKLVVIAGGEGKNADFSTLRETAKKYTRCFILIGKDASLMEAALTDSTTIEHAKTLEEAVSIAQKHAKPGDAVILAPACASFDMFNNFEHRGEVFMAAVKEQLQG